MVKIFCDRCRKDCKLNAYDITVNVLHNPTPHNMLDVGQPCITDDNTHIRFILCQDCYEEIGFPNMYSVERKGLIFERKKGENNGENNDS